LTAFALKGLLGRKLRTALTAVAIVLGVAMVSGTFVLTDSIDKAFDSIFNDSRKGSDLVVSGKSAFDISDDSGSSAPTLPDSLVETIRGLGGVRAAEGSVDGDAQLIGDDGKAVVYGGAPNLGFSIANPESPFNPLTLVDGRWPGPNEVVIDKSTAGKEHFEIGETVAVQAEGPIQRLRLSGLIKFGSVSTIGGATLSGFDLPTAQRLFDKVGRLDEVAVATQPGVNVDDVTSEIEAILPANAQVLSGTEQAAEDASDTNEFISFLRIFLLVFGGVALFVGSFVIANSLSITIAQRTREFATVRTLGASRKQVLGSIVIEALVVGALAAVTGLFLGLGLAKALFWLFDLAGLTLPNNGLIFGARTIIVSLLVGILVTLVASLRPAVRATRVPPIAAVREGATLPVSRFARFRVVGSLVLMALGFAALLWSLFGASGTGPVLLFLGFGAVLLFLGVAMFAARLVQPVAGLVSPLGTWAVVALSAIVWPFWTLPSWLLRRAAWGPGERGSRIGGGVLGVVLLALGAVVGFALGSLVGFAPLGLLAALASGLTLLAWLAQVVRRALTDWRPEWPIEFPGVLPDPTMNRVATENSRRNPQRTASTASALMIGLALVTLVAVLAAGIISTFEGAVDDIFTSDYAITAQNNFSPIPIDAAVAAAKTPGVESIASVRTAEARVYDQVEFITATEPSAGDVLTLDWIEGSQAIFRELGADGAFVDEGYAKDHELKVGSPVVVQAPSGERLRLVVKGIFDPPTGGSPFGHVTFSSATFDKAYPNPENLFTFVQMRGGETPENAAALERTLEDFPNAKSQTRDDFVDNQIGPLKRILNILYVLLALSVFVSFFGIINTLVLTVFERTRELGMLRAIGMTRRQVRRMVRHESVITALLGGALGLLLGIVLGGLLVARIDFIGFALPVVQLVVFAVAAVVVGIVAAIFPARRAARLDPLEALQYE
jgi:ABC-type antimicrobial peptide transport system permease subunit